MLLTTMFDQHRTAVLTRRCAVVPRCNADDTQREAGASSSEKPRTPGVPQAPPLVGGGGSSGWLASFGHMMHWHTLQPLASGACLVVL